MTGLALVRSRRAIVALAVPLAIAAGCDDMATAPSGYAPFAQGDLRVGTGTEAADGNLLTVHYTGWLYDGSQTDQKGATFDSSAGREAFSFTLGVGEVIPGWDRGLPGMRVGGLRRLVIPPSLAYGSARNGPIPPNATLIFEIELLNVE